MLKSYAFALKQALYFSSKFITWNYVLRRRHKMVSLLPSPLGRHNNFLYNHEPNHYYIWRRLL